MAQKAELFLAVLEECDEYAAQQERLAKSLSDGLIYLARARRDNSSVKTIEDIRSDFDATLRISDDIEGELTYQKGDDVQLLCGMPPPSLRKSKEHFRDAIIEAVGMCIRVRVMERRISDITGVSSS